MLVRNGRCEVAPCRCQAAHAVALVRAESSHNDERGSSEQLFGSVRGSVAGALGALEAFGKLLSQRPPSP
eukprot:6701126-Alexandrium_andersonii.AAC.1